MPELTLVGSMFLVLGGVLHWKSVELGGAGFLLHWVGLSFVLVGASYVVRTPRLFGKRADGKLSLPTRLALFPYLALTSATWRLAHWLSKEPPYDELTDRIWIGRRLVRSDPVPEVDVVVDLTCEFDEPVMLRSGLARYLSLPILDRGVPRDGGAVVDLVRRLVCDESRVYVHCAQGHGRTGMIAALFLLALSPDLSAAEALATVVQVRPGVRLSHEQRAFVERSAEQCF